jgi:hypothetical protein
VAPQQVLPVDPGDPVGYGEEKGLRLLERQHPAVASYVCLLAVLKQQADTLLATTTTSTYISHLYLIPCKSGVLAKGLRVRFLEKSRVMEYFRYSFQTTPAGPNYLYKERNHENFGNHGDKNFNIQA